MNRFIICILFSFFLLSPTYAFTINGGVVYTVSSARQESFDGVSKKVDISKYENYFMDKEFDLNQKLIAKKKFKYKDRFITLFSTGDYAVVYKKEVLIGFYYDKNGKLKFVDFDSGRTYPKRTLKYDLNGELYLVGLSPKTNEQFVFDLDKKLISHWIGKNGYDENGELFNTRD